ncbi:hypothetical protein DMB65_02200 [Flavobacterium cheongpyeongense]|uniref:Uncharacterized protein n=1 Tax=Flavobacterium cheongpyeongense TaxID=2212651 RepID=A0A2V4BYT2_9FLAO|nr:hypothetical protein [Flavobacterium cheongpyeongense]PXY42850.1 hypothetical protein DMB65_02200 [Flavobacterium cheongpyeongense]
MKNITLILGVLLISFSAFAQEEPTKMKQSDLKGPAFKNYKVWMHETASVKIYSENNKESLQGPAYKNAQPVINTSNKDLVEVKTSNPEKQKLTGPAYKNHGPWSKNW